MTTTRKIFILSTEYHFGIINRGNRRAGSFINLTKQNLARDKKCNFKLNKDIQIMHTHSYWHTKFRKEPNIVGTPPPPLPHHHHHQPYKNWVTWGVWHFLLERRDKPFFTTLQFSLIAFTFLDLQSFELAMYDFHPRSHPRLVLKPGIIYTFLIYSVILFVKCMKIKIKNWNN